METKLLDLTIEYAAARETEAWGDSLPAGIPLRSMSDIAAEYGATLRAFLAS